MDSSNSLISNCIEMRGLYPVYLSLYESCWGKHNTRTGRDRTAVQGIRAELPSSGRLQPTCCRQVLIMSKCHIAPPAFGAAWHLFVQLPCKDYFLYALMYKRLKRHFITVLNSKFLKICSFSTIQKCLFCTAVFHYKIKKNNIASSYRAYGWHFCCALQYKVHILLLTSAFQSYNSIPKE